MESSALQVADTHVHVDCTEQETRVSSHSRWLAELECGVIVLQVAGGCTALEYGGVILRVTGRLPRVVECDFYSSTHVTGGPVRELGFSFRPSV